MRAERLAGASLPLVMMVALGLPGSLVAQDVAPGPCTGAECCREADGAELRGRVEHQSAGASLRDARVEFRVTHPAGSDAPRTIRLRAPADSAGRYRVCGIPTPAEIEATARAVGAASRSVSFTLSAPERLTLSFTVRSVAAAEDVADSLRRTLPLGPDPDAGEGEPSAVAGRLLDDGTGRAIAEATVRLPALDRGAVTDSRGRFRIDSVPPGEHELRIGHVRYGESTIGVSVPEGRTVALELRIPPQAIELEPVEVRVERTIRPRYLENRGFYERMERGWGHHFSPEFFEENQVADTRQLLQRIPGVRMRGRRIEIPSLLACSGEEQGPVLFVDGHRVGRARYTRTLHEYVSMADVGAMEVYRRPSETAPEFISSDSRCGVIVVWTKHWFGDESAASRRRDGDGRGFREE